MKLEWEYYPQAKAFADKMNSEAKHSSIVKGATCERTSDGGVVTLCLVKDGILSSAIITLLRTWFDMGWAAAEDDCNP